MRAIRIMLIGAFSFASWAVAYAETATKEPIEGQLVRIGGELDAAVQRKGDDYVFRGLRIDTSLPEGYPGPTPPGAIDLKRYPTVRRAEYTGTGSVDSGQNSGFWPLFRHIKKREIAMTAPVEMELEGWESDTSPTRWTMGFLYRTPDLGPTGTDGAVVVRDVDPVTVVAIGVRGDYTQARFNAALEELERWVTEDGRWERAGEARWMGYNGPTLFREKWSEVQIPVRAASIAQETERAQDASEDSTDG